MSTKIYEAYMCDKGFYYVHLIIDELRKEYSDIMQEQLKDITNFKIRKTYIAEYSEDGIVIYPLKDGRILFQLFVNNLPYNRTLPTLSLMLAFNKIKDWHYQNQADPWYIYEELTGEALKNAEQEYIQREKDWNEIFDANTSWVPSEAGFFIPLIKSTAKLHFPNPPKTK